MLADTGGLSGLPTCCSTACCSAHFPACCCRLLTYGPGGVVGEMDFMLLRCRSFTATCQAQGGAWRISRGSFERLAREQPHVSERRESAAA